MVVLWLFCGCVVVFRLLLIGYVSLLVPSGPPMSLRATRIGARMLQVFWKPPEPRKQNGEIVGYRFCIKEKHSSFPCRDHITLTGSPLLSVHTVDDLEPFTVYSIHVEARTALGYGPGQYLDYRTGEAGNVTRVEITFSLE